MNELRNMGRTAIKNTPMKAMSPNSSDSFKFVFDLGQTIGTKGQSAVKLVISELGNIITFYPL